MIKHLKNTLLCLLSTVLFLPGSSLAQNEPVLTIEEPAGVNIWILACSRDNSRLVTSSDDGLVTVWDARKGNPLLNFTGHKDYGLGVASADFSPDGKWIVTGGHSWTAIVWNADTGEVKHVLQHRDESYPAPIIGALFTTDGKKVVTACADGTVFIWDAVTGNALKKIIRLSTIYSVQLSSDNNYLIVDGLYDDELYSMTDTSRVTEFLASDATFSNDGKHVFVVGQGDASGTRVTKELSLPGLEALKAFPFFRSNGMDFLVTPDEKKVIFEDRLEGTGYVDVVNLDSGSKVRRFSKEGGPEASSKKLSPDGSNLIITSNNILRVFDISALNSSILHNNKY